MEKDVRHGLNSGHLTGAVGAAFLLLMNILMIEKDSIGSTNDYPSNSATKIINKLEINFDFVIVGAGAAGCVLANKLTERSEWKVLLIEAGENPSSSSDVPAFYPTLQNTDEDWQFTTYDTKNACQGMVGKICKISKGKVLGGTSTINNMHYLRAQPRDFDKWYDMGFESWGADSVQFFYETLENYNGTDAYPIHFGNRGNLHINSFNSEHYVNKMIYKAANKLGFKTYNAYTYLGYLNTMGMIKNGVRQNMAKAFLNPVKHRPNLLVIKKGYVTKLLIPDVREKRVKGVECFMKDTLIQIKAKREVILSAGAINNVKIMMLSGIGHSKILNYFEMPIVADMNVGRNMQQHFGVPIFVGLDKDNSDYFADQPTELIDSTYLYIMHKTGPLSNTNINDVVGFINTNGDPYGSPDVSVYHYHFVPDDMYLPGILDNIGYQPEIKQSILKYNHNQSLVMFLPTLLKPKSTGKVYLRSTNSFVSPFIKAKYLSDQQGEDLHTLVESFKYIRHLIETSTFKEHKAKLIHVDIPGCRNYKFCTDFFMKCYIKHLGFPQGDVVGTTKMGFPCDKDAIVDEDLSVMGMRGLRIVDASIMPEIVSGNIQTTEAMIANKISECIKERWLPAYQPQPCLCKTSYNN